MARKSKKVEEKAGGGESGTGRWMLTYLDMVTLLFGTFVLLYAMSQSDQKKFEAVSASLKQAFQGGSRSIFPFRLFGSSSLISDLATPGIRQKHFFQRVFNALRPEVNQNIVNVHEDERGIVISFAGNIFFEKNSAVLKEEHKETLIKVTPFLKEINRNIRLEGYTDELNDNFFFNESTNENFTDNWDLAAGRAISVIRFLIYNGVRKDKLSALSYADNKPIISNKFLPKYGTPESRALNNKVEIVIMPDTNSGIK